MAAVPLSLGAVLSHLRRCAGPDALTWCHVCRYRPMRHPLERSMVQYWDGSLQEAVETAHDLYDTAIA